MAPIIFSIFLDGAGHYILCWQWFFIVFLSDLPVLACSGPFYGSFSLMAVVGALTGFYLHLLLIKENIMDKKSTLKETERPTAP